MSVDIEWAKASDTVGQEFESNYIPGTTDKDLEDARALMQKLLKKYGSRDALEADERDWAKYRKAMYVVASRSKGTMKKENKTREELIKRKNQLSQFFDDNREILI